MGVIVMGRISSRRKPDALTKRVQALFRFASQQRNQFQRRATVQSLCGLLLAAIALAISGSGVAAAQDGPQQFVEVRETGKQISGTIEIAADGRANYIFRVQALSGRDTALLQFQPTNLVSAGGVTVSRSGLSVPLTTALGPSAKDLNFVITGLVVPGDYTGEVQVYAPGAPGYQAIPVHLRAIKVTPPALAQESASLTLKLAKSCGWLTRLALEDSACRDSFALAFSSLGRTATPPVASLTLVRSDGSLVPAPTEKVKQPSVAFADGKVTLTIPHGSLGYGHYAGRIRTSFDNGATIVDAPVTIDVRWPAICAFSIILFGVVIGRIQAFMTRTGDTIASSYSKLLELNARANRLHPEYRDALVGPFQRASDDLDDRDIDHLSANLTAADELVRLLEVVMTLVPDPTAAANAAVKQSIKEIEDAVKAGDTAGATAKLAELRTNLTAAGAARAFAGTKKADATRPAPVTNWRRFVTLVIVYGHAVLFAFAVIFIALAGLQTLYVTNGAQLGSSPVSDFLTLFAWGLASDVAGRTLTNFRG